ncbi:MAG TPA: cytochrome c, partial [Chitinophagaceae bacterium]|nr:cytochrome c [Chitinophagaceae bacterium]
MKHYFFVFASVLTISAFIIGCGSSDSDEKKEKETSTENHESDDNVSTDPKGIGEFKNVELTHPLDEAMVASGKSIYEVKCQSCHKLTGEKLVGPGWKGVTDRWTPEWIMNFVTNVDVMLAKDTASQRMLEECLVRMPNQNLNPDDARSMLEFMRKNDGKN